MVGHRSPATSDPLKLCSDSRELPNHGGIYALPFGVSFRFFCVRLASPFYGIWRVPRPPVGNILAC